MAVWLLVAVLSSAVMTCVPRAMPMQASAMPACGEMDMDEASVSSDMPMDCCTHHDPSLSAAKADLLKSPLQETSSWLAWLAPAVVASATLSVITSESPPELISTLGPPTYIALSALRV
jgi:hypothetical protein